MRTKNKFIILGAVLFTATLAQGKQSEALNLIQQKMLIILNGRKRNE